MNDLFENAEKLVKFHRNVSERLEIKEILNPKTQKFISREEAEAFGIIQNGHCQNR